MKKIVILTSMLALAACGGGSGGGAGQSTGDRHTITPTVAIRTSVTGAAAESNAKVTSMNSEVVVGSNGSSRTVQSRASTPWTANGVTYVSYRLDDVKLHPADYDVPAGAYLKIGLDNDGQIDKMTMVMGQDAEGHDIGGDLARDFANSQTGKARFEGPIFEYVEDEYAQDGNSGDFEVANSEDADTLALALLAKVSTKRNFPDGGNWVKDGAQWKYDTDGLGNYQTFDPDGDGPQTAQVFTVDCDDNNDGVKAAVKDAYNFDDGKWVLTGGNWQYIEYGDEAVYRVAATDSVTKDTLDGISANLPSLGHWNRVDEVMEVDTFGKDIDGNGTSLQYSDFGHFNPVYREKRVDLTGLQDGDGKWLVAETGEVKTNDTDKVNGLLEGQDYQLFAGGYAIKSNGTGVELVDTLDAPTSTTTFKGKAIGRVYVSFDSNGLENRDTYLAQYDVPKDSLDGNSYTNKAGHDIAASYTTTHAELKVADGVQTLYMPFGVDNANQFYNVTVTQNVDGSGLNFNFNDVADPDNAPDVHFMADSQYRQTENFSGTPETAFRPGYYGVNTASEAAGTVYYGTEQDIGTGADVGKITREWEFQAAYGMKK